MMPLSGPLQTLLLILPPCTINTRARFVPSSSQGSRLPPAGRTIASSKDSVRSRFPKLRSNDSRVPHSVEEDKEMTGGVPGAAAYPLQRCKTIHLIRHGQGFHNVAGEMDRSAYMSPDFFDASLTALGWKQVAALRDHVRSNGVADSLQLVVVSPLTRTMQTAVGVFGGDHIVNGSSVGTPLMVDGVGKEKHKAISSVGAPPFIAVEWCREHMGLHPCDQRQSITTYTSLFPAIDFSDIEEAEDVLWSPTERETDEQLFGRARKFVQWCVETVEGYNCRPLNSDLLYQNVDVASACLNVHCSSYQADNFLLQSRGIPHTACGFVLRRCNNVGYLEIHFESACVKTYKREIIYVSFASGSIVYRILQRKEMDIAVVSHCGFLFQLTKAVCDDRSSSAVQKEFYTPLLKRKETEIAVVSHSSFLRHLVTTFGDDCSTQIQSELHKYFHNCEMRSIVLVDKRAEEVSKVPTKDFPGGIPPGPDAPSDGDEV